MLHVVRSLTGDILVFGGGGGEVVELLREEDEEFLRGVDFSVGYPREKTGLLAERFERGKSIERMKRTKEEPNEVVGLDESFGVGFLADRQPFEGSNQDPIRTAFDDSSREVGNVRLRIISTRHRLRQKESETRREASEREERRDETPETSHEGLVHHEVHRQLRNLYEIQTMLLRSKKRDLPFLLGSSRVHGW